MDHLQRTIALSSQSDRMNPRTILVASGDELDDSVYPQLYNLSAAFFFQFLPRPDAPAPPEFLYVPARSRSERLGLFGLCAQWNLAWESAQLRQRFLADDLREMLPKLRFRDDINVFLIPSTENRIDAFLPLYMLLPCDIVERFGLPPLRKAIWPGPRSIHAADLFPADAERRLGAAFASLIWPYLVSGSPQRAFDKKDSLVLLSHNLDFWLPHVYSVIQNRLGANELVEFEKDDELAKLERIRGTVPEDVWVDRCRMGGHAWIGKEEAREAVGEVVADAERTSRLAEIIDAIRSNRVEEDFSNHWSYAREDFERKLYSKRSKIRVRFVELNQAEAVVGPFSELTEKLLFEDFFAVLDRRERQIVLCLSRGTTKLGEIAAELGYANHSPVSKALNRIRNKAKNLLQ